MAMGAAEASEVAEILVAQKVACSAALQEAGKEEQMAVAASMAKAVTAAEAMVPCT